MIVKISNTDGFDHYHQCEGCDTQSVPESCPELAKNCPLKGKLCYECQDMEVKPVESKYEVCGRCQGEGTVVNPAFNGITANDIFDSHGYDSDEFFEDMGSGMYDVICPECHGKRVVTKEDIESYAHYVDDSRMRALESGDVETYMNRMW